MRLKDVSKQVLKEKLRKLAQDQGFDDPEEYLDEGNSFNSGICINLDCSYTTDCETGTEEDWCESCETNTVVSGMALDCAGDEEDETD